MYISTYTQKLKTKALKVPKSRRPRFKSQVHHLPAESSGKWVNLSQGKRFLTVKMGIIIPPTF